MFLSFNVQNRRIPIAKFSLQAKTLPFSALIMKKIPLNSFKWNQIITQELQNSRVNNQCVTKRNQRTEQV